MADDLERLHHVLSNAIAVVRATLEGMADGVVAPDARRFTEMIESLERASKLLDELRAIAKE